MRDFSVDITYHNITMGLRSTLQDVQASDVIEAIRISTEGTGVFINHVENELYFIGILRDGTWAYLHKPSGVTFKVLER